MAKKKTSPKTSPKSGAPPSETTKAASPKAASPKAKKSGVKVKTLVAPTTKRTDPRPRADQTEATERPGTVRMRALVNVPPWMAGRHQGAARVERGTEFDVPARFVRRLVARRYAERVETPGADG